MIKKIKKIEDFTGKSDNFFATQKIGNEIKFPFMKNYNISIKDKFEEIVFFENYSEKHLLLSVATFKLFNVDKIILDEIYQTFELYKELYNNDFYCLKFKDSSYSQYGIAFKKSLNNGLYCMFYATKKERDPQSPAEDAFRDNIVYIHNIWEIELSEEFKNKIFQ